VGCRSEARPFACQQRRKSCKNKSVCVYVCMCRQSRTDARPFACQQRCLSTYTYLNSAVGMQMDGHQFVIAYTYTQKKKCPGYTNLSLSLSLSLSHTHTQSLEHSLDHPPTHPPTHPTHPPTHPHTHTHMIQDLVHNAAHASIECVGIAYTIYAYMCLYTLYTRMILCDTIPGPRCRARQH